MRNEKIIQAIAAYLEENTAASGYYEEVQFSCSGGRANHAGFCQEIAAAIAAAIAPHLEEPDFPFSKLFDHMSNEHGLTLLDTELDDIIHIARGK